MSKTALAIRDGSPNYLAKPQSGTKARFTEGVTRLHRPSFDGDYAIAKLHIMQSLGDLSGQLVIGKNVLCAVFCRPKISAGGIIMPDKEVKEDHYQGKAVLIVKKGPSAWDGEDADEAYLESLFGKPKDGKAKAPGVGEWMVANASAGLQMSIMGEGGTRPEGVTFGENIDLYPGDGWPCRLIPDDQFLLWIERPHEIV